MRRKLLIAGCGVLGGQVLDNIALRHPNCHISVVVRNHEVATRRVNLTKYALAQWEIFPTIDVYECDVLHTEKFAEIISNTSPDIIFNATTPFPWWKIDELPKAESRRCALAGPGMWAAFDVLLPLAISESITRSGCEPIYVNACYPDMTNVFLADEQSAPLVGIGNIANIVPGLRLAFARHEGLKPKLVRVKIVCHHFTSLNGPVPDAPNSAPFFLEVTTGPKKTTFQDDDWPLLLFRSNFPRTRGVPGQAVTVASASTLLSTLIAQRRAELHAPGPNGQPGGYPIVISEDASVTLDLPDDLALSAAIEINERGQRLDGIETVQPNRVVPTLHAQEVFREVVGFALPQAIDRGNALQITVEATGSLNRRFGLGLHLL